MDAGWRFRWRPLLAGGAFVAGLATLAALWADPSWAGVMPPEVTPVAKNVRQLFDKIWWICLAIFIVVWGLLLVTIVRFREKPGENREPAKFSHNTDLEVLWTIIPTFICIFIAYETWNSMALMEKVPPEKDAIPIEVKGYQWYWEYKYPEEGIQFTTGADPEKGLGKPLIVPKGKTIKMQLTAADVIHAWFVPALGVKIDTIPGRVNHAWFRALETGYFKGNCTELCGVDHGKMWISVKVLEEKEYEEWVKAQPKMFTPKPKEGVEPKPGEQVASAPVQVDPKMLYEMRCASCHQVDGKGNAAFPPLAGAEIANGPADAHIKVVLNGLTGPITRNGQTFNGVMPPFASQLTDEEIAAIVTHERTAWGNHGGKVTADQVKALRGK